MYEKYRINGDGTPKYDNGEYHIVPERRLEDSTDEWNRRLDGKTGRLPRRKSKKNSSKTAFAPLLCLIGCMTLIIIVNQENISKLNFFNKNLQSSVNTCNLKINTVTSDFGNEFVHPSEGTKFLYVNTTLENLSDNPRHITQNDFTLICDDGQKVKPVNLYSDSNEANLNPHKKLSQNLTFQVPKNYSGDIKIELINYNIKKDN
ncbi:Telomeric repeat-binding factor 2 [[Clostridium] sordellii]|uniref:DUF4352 domain-containing protein n=1 Tax=Paraclostridium sordellii TaxID=1505 RepID=UPI000542D15E|nr:DUF4352 domain-containing protein [Paeniclostridium sordellii]CEK35170.1 Telomeric repeat-binding factor 2 [[Clostridium] sordellii] [Paeniclostridium sordellii]